MAATVQDVPDEDRYNVMADGEVAGFTAYHRRPGLIAFVHTQIDPRFEGRGLGSDLVRGALEDARREGMEVLPFCPFVNGYVERHREWADLVPKDFRERFGL